MLIDSGHFKTNWKHFLWEVGKMDVRDSRVRIWVIQQLCEVKKSRYIMGNWNKKMVRSRFRRKTVWLQVWHCGNWNVRSSLEWGHIKTNQRRIRSTVKHSVVMIQDEPEGAHIKIQNLHEITTARRGGDETGIQWSDRESRQGFNFSLKAWAKSYCVISAGCSREGRQDQRGLCFWLTFFTSFW